MQESYITERERKKCQKVVEVFREIIEGEDLVVMDAGRFGFVKVQYFRPDSGFDSVFTFNDGAELFEDLWEDWFNAQLTEFASGTPMEDLKYEDIFKCMPKEKQEYYQQKKQELMEKAGFFSVFTKVSS